MTPRLICVQSLNLPIESLQQSSPDDAEMDDITHEIAESNNALKDAVDARAFSEEPLKPLPVSAQVSASPSFLIAN